MIDALFKKIIPHRVPFLILILLFTPYLYSHQSPDGKVFMHAELRYCSNNSKEHRPWCTERKEDCLVSEYETYIKSICSYQFHFNSSFEDDEWTLVVYGPEYKWDSADVYPSGDYFIYINKTLRDGEAWYSVHTNGDKNSTKAGYKIGDNFKCSKEISNSNKVDDLGRYIFTNDNAKIILDFSTQSIHNK